MNRLIFENFYKKGLLAFVLPLDVVRRLVPGCHFNPLSWTEKEGKVQGRCTNLLGSKAVEETKSVYGRRLTAIGYDVDLDRTLATVFRALHGFLIVDVEAPVMVQFLQKLASWGSRYSYICSYLKLFVRALYNEYTGRSNSQAFVISENARRAIRMFRVFLLFLAAREHQFARQLSSFETSSPKFVVVFDASLTGVGIWGRGPCGGLRGGPLASRVWFRRLKSEYS